MMKNISDGEMCKNGLSPLTKKRRIPLFFASFINGGTILSVTLLKRH